MVSTVVTGFHCIINDDISVINISNVLSEMTSVLSTISIGLSLVFLINCVVTDSVSVILGFCH